VRSRAFGESELMLEHARHVPLRPLPWNASEVATAIEEAVSDALVHFEFERFWPAHPLDEGLPDGHTSFYCGATGVIWALEYLGRMGATKTCFDFRPVLPRLMEANKAEFTSQDYSAPWLVPDRRSRDGSSAELPLWVRKQRFKL
jgi:hypothetical protein